MIDQHNCYKRPAERQDDKPRLEILRNSGKIKDYAQIKSSIMYTWPRTHDLSTESFSFAHAISMNAP
jgi:hypothetical protein